MLLSLLVHPQDILALMPSYCERPAREEIINDPTKSKHYWRYRWDGEQFSGGEGMLSCWRWVPDDVFPDTIMLIGMVHAVCADGTWVRRPCLECLMRQHKDMRAYAVLMHNVSGKRSCAVNSMPSVVSLTKGIAGASGMEPCRCTYPMTVIEVSCND